MIADADRVRALLVHANPFQNVTPVPAYGLERIRTAAAGRATIELLDPYLVAEDALAAARAAATRFRPQVIGLGIRVVEDCIVIDELDDESSDGPIDVAWFMPEIRRLRDALREAAPDALFVLGGAAFSAMPGECLDYLDVELGVVGAGEKPFAQLLEQVSVGQPIAGIPGLVRRGQRDMLKQGLLPTPDVTRRDPLYAPANSFPVRTRAGCAMACAYCLTANMLRRHVNLELEPVLAEIAAIVEEASERGIGSAPIFFADDEFNLPDERHAIALLGGIRERGLSDRMSWRAYVNPTPFSDELARLVKATNGHVSVTVDTASEAVMARAAKPFRRRHLEELVQMLVRHEVPADLGLIFGLPGETEDTIAETLEFVRSLPQNIDVVYSAGARVYPHTPLARIAAAEPALLVGADDPSFFEPVVYSSPLPPRELARLLEQELYDLPNVRRVGVGYGRGRTTFAAAYRAVLAGDRRAWRDVLADAEEPGEYQRSPAEVLGAVAQIAIWHRRLDLASTALRFLARQQQLPEGVSRRQVRTAGLLCAGLGAFDRARSRGRPRSSSPAYPSES